MSHLSMPTRRFPPATLRHSPHVSPRQLTLLALVGPVGALAAYANPAFLSVDNLRNVAIQASYLTVFATAQAFVLLIRGFDLSLGNTVSVASILTALFSTQALALGWSGGTAALGGLGAGTLAALLIGTFNGAGVAYLRINTFVVTLGSLNVALGVASMVSGGQPVGGLPEEFTWIFYRAAPLGAPAPILWVALLLLFLHLVLEHTVIGRAWFLIGGNPRAAELSGIAVKRLTLLAYIACSLAAALGAMLLTARTGSGEPNLGGNLTLESVAAAAIGGVSLKGGRASALAVLSGALFITFLSNAMNMMEVNGYFQQMILGAIVILAVSTEGR